LRLHYNENTAGCSPAALEALRGVSREEIASYPDYAAITAQTARWLGISPEWVQLTNGLDEGLHAVAQYAAWHAEAGAGAAGVQPRAQFILAEPTFEMFEEFADIVRAELVRVAPEPEFRFPLDAIIAAVQPRTRLIYLVDPNNPTGTAIPIGAAEAVAAAAPQALVFVDEAYSDFSGRTLIGPALELHRNLVIGRTFAKGHGLAALRIGALVAHPTTLDRVRQMLPPFNVNICAVRALGAALDDHGYLEWSVAQALESRGLIVKMCERQHLKYWPSDGNFVLVRIGPEAGAVAAALRDRGILVRDKSAARGCEGCLRITAGVVEHTSAMLAALEDILASRAY
jgi:histidinol-phosphate aminotransferase